MVTLLILSLVIVHRTLIREDFRDYRCHVGSTWAAGRVPSVDVFLKAPGIAETRGKLSRNHKVTILECFTANKKQESSMQVNLLHLEKTRGDLTERTAKECTVESLQVIHSTAGGPAPHHPCVLRTSMRRHFHQRFIFRSKVFLAVILNHTTPTTPLQQKVFTNGSSTTPHVHQEKQPSQERIPSTNGRDLLTLIQNKRISIKVLIACNLLTLIIYFCVMIFIHERNHLCSGRGWICSRRSRSKGMSAASIPADHQSATLSAQLLEDTKKSLRAKIPNYCHP